MEITILKTVTCHGGFNIPEGTIKKSLGEGFSDEKKRKFQLVESNVVKNGVTLPIAIYDNEYIINGSDTKRTDEQ